MAYDPSSALKGGIHSLTAVVSTVQGWWCPPTLRVSTHPTGFKPPYGGEGRLDVEGVPHKAMTPVGYCQYMAHIAGAAHRHCQCGVRLLVQGTGL